MSQHKRNVEGMQNAIRNKSQISITRVEAVIQQMLNDKQVISFNNIAKQANVSKAWLYAQNNLCTKIKEYRSQNHDAHRPILPSAIESRDAMITSLKNRLKESEIENAELRKQLEIVYGELHKKNHKRNVQIACVRLTHQF